MPPTRAQATIIGAFGLKSNTFARTPSAMTRWVDRRQERDGPVWRRLHVTYPHGLTTHSREQTCYFDEAGLLRRLDYTAEVFCHLARGAHYCEAYKKYDDLLFPTYRVVFARRASGHPFRLVSLMEGWVDNVIVQ